MQHTIPMKPHSGYTGSLYRHLYHFWSGNGRADQLTTSIAPTSQNENAEFCLSKNPAFIFSSAGAS